MKNLRSLLALPVVLLILFPFLTLTTYATEAYTAAEAPTVSATESPDENATGDKALAAALSVGIAAAAGAIAMGIAIAKSTTGMAHRPEVAGKINSAMMLGLVFIETLIIYALIVAILIIFVL